MSKPVTLVAIVLLGALAAWHLVFKPRQEAGELVAPTPGPVATVPAAPERTPPATPEPPPTFVAPVPVDPPRPPLPPLDDSDPVIGGALAQRLPAELVSQLLVPTDIVRRLVVTVDNLPRDGISMKVRAVRAMPDRFLTRGEDETLTMDPANETRYEGFMTLLASTDPAVAGDVYIRFYPLLQSAYQDLGYPDRQFHNRLLDVVDHLLETPALDTPVRLRRPHVLYEFADPALERLSAGQKMLLRMGPDHAATAKRWLSGFRTELAGRVVD